MEPAGLPCENNVSLAFKGTIFRLRLSFARNTARSNADSSRSFIGMGSCYMSFSPRSATRITETIEPGCDSP
jgi:hypothetical protein